MKGKQKACKQALHTHSDVRTLLPLLVMPCFGLFLELVLPMLSANQLICFARLRMEHFLLLLAFNLLLDRLWGRHTRFKQNTVDVVVGLFVERGSIRSLESILPHERLGPRGPSVKPLAATNCQWRLALVRNHDHELWTAANVSSFGRIV